MKNKARLLLTIAGILFLTAGILTTAGTLQNSTHLNERASASTILSISPQTQTVTAGENTTFSVMMDTSNNQVTGFDLILHFDPNIFHITSLQKGSGIQDFSNIVVDTFDNTSGTINYTAFTIDKSLAVKGSNIEVLKIDALTNINSLPKNYLIEFDATSAISATNESQNALTDAAPGKITINVSPTSAPTTSPTNQPGEPNSCNGTCGSNINCQSSYMCYQGYCRNPNCPSETSCGCREINPTPLPTARPRTTTKPQVEQNTEPEIVVYAPIVVEGSTPIPVIEESNFWETVPTIVDSTPAPTFVPQPVKNTNLPWIIGSFLAIGITLTIIAIWYFKHDGIHKIRPPVIKI